MSSEMETQFEVFSASCRFGIDQDFLFRIHSHYLEISRFSSKKCPSLVWHLRAINNNDKKVKFIVRNFGCHSCGVCPAITSLHIKTSRLRPYVSLCRTTGFFLNECELSIQEDVFLSQISHGYSSLHFELEFIFNAGIAAKNVVVADEYREENELFSAVFARNSFRELWESEKLSDCTILVGEQKMNAHRCVLAQHSEVFLKMFEQKEMAEGVTGQLKIADASPESIRAMLQFFYTGSVDKTVLEDFSNEVFMLADKYIVKRLRIHCEYYLASTIEVENCVRRCVTASDFNLSILKKACSDFVSSNYASIVSTPEWKEFKETHAGFALDLAFGRTNEV